MSEFLNTGIQTEDVTLFLVFITLIVGIILSLSIYQLQKTRPKLKYMRYSVRKQSNDEVHIRFSYQNIGSIIIEDVDYEITSETKGVKATKLQRDKEDIMPTNYFMADGLISIKPGEKGKIKVKISYANHTFKFKKRDSLTSKFSCDKKVDGVKFDLL